MLKTRIMPTLLYRGSGLVKGVGFDAWRTVGAALQAVRVYNLRQVDELVFLDIDATREGRAPDYGLIDDLADDCFMPLTVGGGIRSVEHVKRLLEVGADKVSIGSAAIEVEGLVANVADRFGAQCVVASVDVRSTPEGWRVARRSGTCPTDLCPIEWSRRLEAEGAGEILLTSVERDGTMQGYDVELCRAVSDAVGIPVIASGGAGCTDHVRAVLREGNASAAAMASVFHFTELTPLEIKAELRGDGFPMRSSSLW
ncbi:MAG: imidazole glycerol phosphate synthase subunit HisF [Nannocystaceae bacterium]|nr:imidazole glycerol phosphate synthase cyclase subunit [bacterium]